MREILTTIRGNATRAPEDRTNKDGSRAANLRLAVNSRYYNRVKGEFADRKPEYVTVYCHRRLAEHALASVKKGQPLVVTGRVGLAEWTREDGTEGYSLTMQADAIGHDLSFGTTTFTKAVRNTDAPDIDPDTGYTGSGDEIDDDVAVDADGVVAEAAVDDEPADDYSGTGHELAGSGAPAAF